MTADRVRLRNLAISVFVIIWIAVFQYETLRLNYLSPLAGRMLPKVKFLYPPAGWIMFFQVDRLYGFAEVYGLHGRSAELIDPPPIFATTFIGYDNIRRNVLISALSPGDGPRSCPYLDRKFPQYDGFAVVYAVYPDVVGQPDEVRRRIAYQCP